MPKQPLGPFRTCFARLLDPWVERSKHHQLLDIVLIVICAVICGAEGWVEVKAFGWTKEVAEALPGPATRDAKCVPRHVWAGVCRAGCGRVSALFSGVGAVGEGADGGPGGRH